MPRLVTTAIRTACALRGQRHRSIFIKSWGLPCCVLMHRAAHQRTYDMVLFTLVYMFISCRATAEAGQVGNLHGSRITYKQMEVKTNIYYCHT